MTLKAGLFHLVSRMSPRDRRMALRTFHLGGHHIRLRLLLTERFTADKRDLCLMAVRTVGLGLMVTAEAVHPGLIDFPVFLSGDVADVAVQQSRNVLLVRKGDAVDHDLCIFKTSVALTAL